MSNSEIPLHDEGVLALIHKLAARGVTGRLEIHAGTTAGAFFLKDGKLVDAKLGHVTGFQAVNAVASMRDAHFNFDPTIAPPASSSITSNERVVLKQFFGIETADPEDLIVHQEALAAGDLSAEDLDEATVVSPSAAEVVPVVVDVLPYAAPPRRSYGRAIALALVAIMFAAAAAVLTYMWHARNAQPPVVAAATTQPSEPVAATTTVEEPKQSAPSTAPQAGSQSASQGVSQPGREPMTQPTREQSRQATQDLTGKWEIVNTVETTSYRPYQSIQIGFDLSIDQKGTTFTGKGQKISENGRSLPPESRTPIEVKGSVRGDRVEATFYEDGRLRRTNGRFVWRIDRAGRGLKGVFATTAARSSGKSSATRNL